MTDNYPKTKWWCCEFCEDAHQYHIFGDGTTNFPRGEWLAHGVRNDYITTGFDTQEEARAYLNKQLTKKRTTS